jgi:hypothetical protein
MEQGHYSINSRDMIHDHKVSQHWSIVDTLNPKVKVKKKKEKGPHFSRVLK